MRWLVRGVGAERGGVAELDAASGRCRPHVAGDMIGSNGSLATTQASFTRELAEALTAAAHKLVE